MSSVCYVKSRRVVSWSLFCSNRGVAGSSEMFVFICQVTSHHIPEESNKRNNPVYIFKSCLGNILK
jgi:hypothetical protein